jgi:hypothetical protein
MKTEDLSFEEAVRALVDKRCDAIETDKPYSIGKICFIWRGGHLQWENGNDANITPHDVLTKRFRLINPKHKTRPVIMKRYKILYDNGELSGQRDFGSIEELMQFCPDAKPHNIIEGVYHCDEPLPEEVTEWEGEVVSIDWVDDSIAWVSGLPKAWVGRRVKVKLKDA